MNLDARRTDTGGRAGTDPRGATSSARRPGTTRHDAMLEVRSGRSSHGMIPWLGLEAEGRGCRARRRTGVERQLAHHGAVRRPVITAGISPWLFAVELGPGEECQRPERRDRRRARTLDEASLALQRAVRDDWMPRTAVHGRHPGRMEPLVALRGSGGHRGRHRRERARRRASSASRSRPSTRAGSAHPTRRATGRSSAATGRASTPQRFPGGLSVLGERDP